MKATLTSKGQITIPIRIRRRLGLVAGSVLEFEEEAPCLVAHRVIHDAEWREFGKAARNPWPDKDSREILADLRGSVNLPLEGNDANGG